MGNTWIVNIFPITNNYIYFTFSTMTFKFKIGDRVIFKKDSHLTLYSEYEGLDKQGIRNDKLDILGI